MSKEKETPLDKKKLKVHEDSLEELLSMAQLILKIENVQELLSQDSNKNTNFWSAFFQVVLSRFFGKIAPGIDNWSPIAQKLNEVCSQIEKDNKFLFERVKPYENSIYTVVQFWNADDIRSTAFLVQNDSDTTSAKKKNSTIFDECYFDYREDWSQRWKLMYQVNRAGIDNSTKIDPLLPRNIGNFIVRRSQDHRSACLPFQLHLVKDGADYNYLKFLKILGRLESWSVFDIKSHKFKDLIDKIRKKEDEIEKEEDDYKSIEFKYLEVPQKIVNSIINNLDEIIDTDIHKEASLIFDLASKDENWNNEDLNSYMLYMSTYIYSNFYSEEDFNALISYNSVPNKEELRLILLNNLRIAIPFKPGEKTVFLHYQYCIPVWNKSASYFFIVTENEIPKKEFRLITLFANRLFGLAWVYDSLRSLEQKKKDFIRQSEKAARAAIMARNMSHNLGSHVLFYSKISLADVNSVLEENALKDLINYDLCIFKSKTKNKEGVFTCFEGVDEIEPGKSNIIKNAVEFPFLIGIGRLLTYLQERQDYIATVATGFTPYLGKVNFKDSIFDEINSDYRFERHKHERTGNKPDNLLLDNIIRSEGFRRKNVKIKYNNCDGTLENSVGVGKLDLDSMRKLYVSLPGGITGRQAIFSIIENILRNAAKHGGKSLSFTGQKNNISLTLNIIDPVKNEKSNYFLDLLEVKNKKTEFANKHYIVTITDNNGNATEDLIKKLNTSIDSDYIKKDGSLDPSNKGLKEIRISAAWLRKIDNERNLKSKIVQVDFDNENNLRYVFCIIKPQFIAFVFPDELSKLEKNIREQNKIITQDEYNNYLNTKNQNSNNHGIWFIKECDFLNKQNDFDFELVVAQTDAVYKNLLPSTLGRIIRFNFKENLNNSEYFKRFAQSQIDFEAPESVILPKIFIYDKKSHYIVNKTDCEVDFKKSESIIIEETEKDFYSNQIVFKQHYDTDENFYKIENFLKSKKINQIYIESITGHNSTDRLIRNTELDDIWAYKMIAASITKVAIFDERLFQSCYKVSENQINSLLHNHVEFNITKLNLKNIFKNTNDSDENVTQYENFADKIEHYKLSARLMKRIEEEFNPLVYKSYGSSEEKINKLSQKLKEIITDEEIIKIDLPESACTLDKKAITYSRRNTFLFTIEWDSVISKNIIIGIDLESTSEPQIKKVGEFYLNDKEELNFILNNEFKNMFHYVSIHQSLLGKIYDHFSFSSKNEKTDTTNLLSQNILKKGYSNIQGTEYHNGLIIHSGRSKPSEEDMPQKQPFIQYSALENAVNDCKFTLVELLTSSKYE